MPQSWSKRRIAFLAAAVALAALPACTSQRMVDAGKIYGPIQSVTERHDQYVSEDSSLSQTEKETFLRSSELLRSIVEEAMNGGSD